MRFVTLAGYLMLAGSVGWYLTMPTILRFSVRSLINLKEDGLVFPQYKTPPYHSDVAFYFYHVKNPRAYLRGEKLSFEIKGPYLYTGHPYRDNVQFTEKSERVKWDQHKKLYRMADQPKDINEKMWVINPIVPSTLKQVRSIALDRIPFRGAFEPIVLNGVNMFLEQFGERLFLRKSPAQLIDGFTVDLLETITSLADRFGLRSLVPPGPPENKFGLGHAQNVTIDKMEVWTGVGNPDRFADVQTFRGTNPMKVWYGDSCNKIAGTNGELFKPFPAGNKKIQVFLAQVCRGFKMDPVNDGNLVEITNGIRGYEFELGRDLFEGVRNNSNKRCYCADVKTYDCQLDGLINMGPCFFEAPLFFTKSNFKGVHKKITSLLDESTIRSDIVPEKSSLWLEKITATPVRANVTLLGTVKVVKQPYMKDLANVQNLTYVPFFVLNEVSAANILKREPQKHCADVSSS